MAKGDTRIIKTEKPPSIVKQAVFHNSGGPIKSFEPGHQFGESLKGIKGKLKVKR